MRPSVSPIMVYEAHFLFPSVPHAFVQGSVKKKVSVTYNMLNKQPYIDYDYIRDIRPPFIINTFNR
jgi:hypothetical protein